MTDDLIARTEALVRDRLMGEGTGHDWWHTDRVRRMALRLGAEEGADPTVVELAALLHDLHDWKFHGGDEEVGPEAAATWLRQAGADEATVRHVREIVATLSFKGHGVATPMRTREGAVVQDADRLDALGAIGIARAFAYGGFKERVLYDPTIPPELHATAERYKTSTGTTINHFHEKLLHLRDRMNTAAARRIAAERHRYIEAFLARFHAEWSGDA